MMNFSELVKKARTYRRFDADKKIDQKLLESLIDIVRNVPSPANIQPLRYCIVTDESVCAKIISQLSWAAYLTDWNCPKKNEVPTGYIVILRDINFPKIQNYDEGIALQTIQLAAAEKNLGSCCFGSFKKEEMKILLQLSENYEVSLVIALGYPSETVILEDVSTTDDALKHKYYRDSSDFHHVPKRTLDEVLIKKI